MLSKKVAKRCVADEAFTYLLLKHTYLVESVGRLTLRMDLQYCKSHRVRYNEIKRSPTLLIQLEQRKGI